MPTHYDTLGLTPGATADDVRSAYRRLAREVHPDVNKAPDAKERFQRLQVAYEVLSDARRRRAYDALLGARTATEGRQADERRRMKEQAEAEELKKRAEARMRDAPPAPRIDLEETRRLTGLLNAGRLAEAERLALRMLLLEPRQPVPNAVLGDLARFRGEFDKALQYYGYAAQYEPNSAVYQRKYEEMLAAQSTSPGPFSDRYVPEVAPKPLVFGSLLVVVMSLYVPLARELPLGLAFAPAWTFGNMALLFVSGIVAGSCLSLSGALVRFDAATGAAMARVPPATALGILSVVSFWLACALYLVVGQTQQAFNRSLSLVLGTVTGVVAVFSLAALAKGGDVALQNLAWGGNLTYFGAVAGWFVSDSLRSR